MQKMECPICGSKGVEIFKSQHMFQVAQCKNPECIHYWLPNRKPDQGVHHRNPILEIESNENLRQYGKRNERLLKMFLNEIKWDGEKHLQICDFGSGCAHIARSIKKHLGQKALISCIESNDKALPFYANWGLSGKSNINELPDHTFDLIYMVEVIEHLDNLQPTLIALRNKLKQNGTIFITTPEGRNNENETIAYSNPAHIHFFTENSLDILLTDCNLAKLRHVNADIMYTLPEDTPLTKKESIAKTAYEIKVLLGKIVRTIIRPKAKAINQSDDEMNIIDMTPRRHHLVGFTKRIDE